MFERLKILYNRNKIGELQLAKAVELGYISEEQKQLIINGN